MKGSLHRQASRSGSLWTVLLAMVGLLFLISCSAVSNQVDRYEENYNQEYGAALQDQDNPGLIHYEDEYVLILTLRIPGCNSLRIDRPGWRRPSRR